jgi:hypothetical protein
MAGRRRSAPRFRFRHRAAGCGCGRRPGRQGVGLSESHNRGASNTARGGRSSQTSGPVGERKLDVGLNAVPCLVPSIRGVRAQPWFRWAAGQAALRAVAPEAGPFVTSVQVEYQRAAPACSWPTAPARGMCASSWRRTQLIGRVLVLVHHGGSAAPSGAELASSWSSSHSKSTITSALRFSLAVTGRRPAASRVGAALFSGLDGTIAASGDGS